MEIKPQELRLGNIIQRKVWGEGVVTKIGPDGFVTIQPKKLMGEISCTCIELSGIELSPEWLDRVDWKGYKYLYFNSHFCLDEQGHLYYHGDYTGINVNYVHTLQNLYYDLKGEELAIDKTSLI